MKEAPERTWLDVDAAADVSTAGKFL